MVKNNPPVDLFGLDSLGYYTDKISETYENFMREYETKGLQWAWLMRQEFWLVPEDKKVMPFMVSLPLLTYTRIQLSKSEQEINQEIEKLKEKYATLPEFQGRPMPTVPTLRDFLDQFFMIYGDDEIEFKIKYYHHTLVHQQGLIKDMYFNLFDVIKNPKVRVAGGDMVSVSIKLLKKGEQRSVAEYKAFMQEPDAFVKEKLNSQVISERFKTLSPTRLAERKQLFSILETDLEVVWDVKNLPTTDVLVIEEMINAAANEDLTNEQVLAQTKCIRLVNLEKMTDWLSRTYAGGTDEDFRD